MSVLPGVAESFRDTVLTGPILLAIPVAAIAGLVSFLSPCVLPLVPGYLSFITGLSGVELEGGAEEQPRRAHVGLAGLLFVLGFTVVFVSYGALFGGLGSTLQDHQVGITRVLGALVIVMGLAFAGVLSFIPGLGREFRLQRLPATGLAGAPLLGLVFGLGWTPCIGFTLGAVLTLAYDSATAGRGAVLSFAYCMGLGLPFVVAALAFKRSMTAFAVVKRHYRAVTMVGGLMLVAIGTVQVLGVWDDVTLWLVTHLGVNDFTVGV